MLSHFSSGLEKRTDNHHMIPDSHGSGAIWLLLAYVQLQQTLLTTRPVRWNGSRGGTHGHDGQNQDSGKHSCGTDSVPDQRRSNPCQALPMLWTILTEVSQTEPAAPGVNGRSSWPPQKFQTMTTYSSEHKEFHSWYWQLKVRWSGYHKGYKDIMTWIDEHTESVAGSQSLGQSARGHQ